MFWGECVSVSQRKGADTVLRNNSFSPVTITKEDSVANVKYNNLLERETLAYVLEYITQIRMFTVILPSEQICHVFSSQLRKKALQ